MAESSPDLTKHYHGMYFFTEPWTPQEIHDWFYPLWNKCAPERFTVDPFSIADAKYIAKYSLKSPHLDFSGIEPVFSLQSRQPGIGSGFFSSQQHDQVLINRSTLVHDSAGTNYSLPRYYRDKMFSPLERKNIADEFQRKEQMYKALLCGDDMRRQALFEYDSLQKALLSERDKVIKSAIEDFGKDCKVPYSCYLYTVTK